MAAPAPPLSFGRKLTLRRLAMLAQGIHPLTRLPLHVEAPPVADQTAPGRRCGTCALRSGNSHGYQKCHLELDRAQSWLRHGAATDVRAWWPGCERHEYPAPAS